MKFVLVFLFLFFNSYSFAQPNNFVQDSIVLDKFKAYTLTESVCYYDLQNLCKKIGHRISGSTAAAKAVEWARQVLINAGADTVYLQPVMVPHWVRGKEDVILNLKNKKKIKLNPLGIGNSDGTNGKPVSAPVVMVNSKEDLEGLQPSDVKGKIVFFNHVWDQSKANPFHEYGGCVYYRWAGPSLAAKYGAVGCVIRSAGSAYDSFAHTGSMRYDSAYPRIPAMALSYKDAVFLEQLINKKEINQLTINSTSYMDAEVLSYNVVGEIIGTELSNEIITFGGHLDSWDVGEGAHDDGAGVVQCIEVIRAIKNARVNPKRTLRCVLFMNEENGLRGGKEYARLAKQKNENHICAIETDAGGTSPRGFNFSGTEAQRNKVKSWLNLFYPLGVYDFEEEGGGADIGPLKENKVTNAVMGLFPDPQRYFDLHHTHNDVFEQVNRRELSMGAVAMTMMVYMLSEYGL
jgi:carboxypeptidase Q